MEIYGNLTYVGATTRLDVHVNMSRSSDTDARMSYCFDLIDFLMLADQFENFGLFHLLMHRIVNNP